jgi:hypothetical protein
MSTEHETTIPGILAELLPDRAPNQKVVQTRDHYDCEYGQRKQALNPPASA